MRQGCERAVTRIPLCLGSLGPAGQIQGNGHIPQLWPGHVVQSTNLASFCVGDYVVNWIRSVMFWHHQSNFIFGGFLSRESIT